MNIRKIIKEEIDDFGWISNEQDPISYLDEYYKNLHIHKDGPFVGRQNISELLRELKLDYRALFGIIRQPNKIYWEITDVQHPIKDLFSYEGFKNPSIRRTIKNYYKDYINSLERKIKAGYISGAETFGYVRQWRTGDTGPR